MSAKLVEVIEVTTTYGKGTDENPFRSVTEYWSTKGFLLAVNDPCALRAHTKEDK